MPTYPLAVRYGRNLIGNDYYVADTHGTYAELHALLDQVGFDPTKDRLFLGGDLVDRGPDCDDVTKLLTWAHAVRGNHDQFTIDIAEGGEIHDRYVSEGGGWFLALTSERQQEIAEAIRQLPLAIQVSTAWGEVGIVHAAPLDDWTETLRQLDHYDTLGLTKRKYLFKKLMWSRSRYDDQNPTPVTGIDLVLVGHKAVPNVLKLGNTQYMDTGCGKGGHLTIINLAAPDVLMTLPNPPRYIPKPKEPVAHG